MTIQIKGSVLAADTGLASATDPGVMSSSDKVKLDATMTQATTAAITYYVDPVSGLDSNTGLSSGTAFLTVEHALNLLPIYINHTVVIQVLAGTLSVTAVYNFPQFKLSSTGSLAIVGTMADYTPAGGIATGTFDAAWSTQTYDTVAVVTGAGWTTDEMAGMFVQLTNGANVNRLIPIMNNTATTLTLVQGDTSVVGASGGGLAIKGQTFKFVKPASIVSVSSTTNRWNALHIEGGTLSSSSPYTTTPTLSGLTFARLAFTTSTAGAVTVSTTNSIARFTECTFVKTGISHGFGSVGVGACYIDGQTYTANSILAPAGHLLISGVGIKGGASSPLVLQLTAGYDRPGYCGCGSLFIQMVSNSASAIQAGLGCKVAYTGPIILVGPPTPTPASSGINLYAAGLTTGSSGGGSSSTRAIHIKGFYTGISLMQAAIMTNSLKTLIDSCTTGMKLDTNCAYQDAYGSSPGALAVTNSTGYGVYLCSGLDGGAYNSFTGNSSVTMSGNVSGDFTVDGSTAISLATLRATSPKRIADVTTFNMLAER